MNRSIPPTAAESLGKSVVRVSCGERFIEWKLDVIRSLPAVVSQMHKKEWLTKDQRPWSVVIPRVCQVIALGDGRELRRYRVRPTKWILRHDTLSPSASLTEGPELTVEVVQ